MEQYTTLPDPLQWSEGLMLSPQHLQQHDIYLHAQLTHRLMSLTPHFWGVRRLEIDTLRVASGTLRVTELECILPDGLAVLFPGHYGHVSLEVDIAKPLSERAGAQRVWLVVPARGTTAATLGSAVQRFDPVSGELAADENTGDGQVPIERLRARISLYVGNDVPARYTACPIAEVERDDKGLLRLTRYHPPMMRMDVADFLKEQGLSWQLRLLMQELWSKARTLAGDRQDSQHDDLPSEQHRALAAARHLALGLPSLEVAVSAGDIHPVLLYRALMQMVGAVASIGANPIPPIPDAYRHDDCVAQFDTAINYIRDKLALVDTAYDSQPFARVGDSGFARRLPDDVGEVLIELKPRAGQTLTEIAHWLGECRIGSDELMPVLQTRRLPGATARALSPSEINARKLKPGSAFFIVHNEQLEINGDLAHAYRPGRSLLIQGVANLHMPAAILLYRSKVAIPAQRVAEPTHG
ncbi:MAG TPA: type VI secretion system baseplate subunit TssK [Chitinolyticbacter sp.]|nr:type VI secretion system baseplate subunit TssK [Chitinolyticbacter sp.]